MSGKTKHAKHTNGDVEYRHVRAKLSIREDDGEGPLRVGGYALRWDEVAEIGTGFWRFREQFQRGAFKETLRDDDHNQGFLQNHGGNPYATTRSGTLRLKEDKKGLLLEAEMDRDDPEAMSLYRKIDRGLVDGLSVGFSIGPNGSVRIEEFEDEPDLHTIERVGQLHEVSATWIPAYESSDLDARIRERKSHQRVSTAPLRAHMLRAVMAAEINRRV